MVQRLRPRWRRNRLEKKHSCLREHAQKVPKLLFSNLNFSIDVCLQIPFCIRLQLKIMIFAPFVRKKQTLCSIFSGNARWPLFSGEPFLMAKIMFLIQKGNHFVVTTALGLKPGSSLSNTKLQINFSCLMSRYYIWRCKLRDEIPNLPQFLRLLKKKIQPSALKMETLLSHL